jgi:hypothetical protein
MRKGWFGKWFCKVEEGFKSGSLPWFGCRLASSRLVVEGQRRAGGAPGGHSDDDCGALGGKVRRHKRGPSFRP